MATKSHHSQEKTETPHRLVTASDLERLVGLEFIRATEAAALSAYKWMGKGDKESGDFAACDAIRGHFDSVNISGLVTIGEGIKDGAPGIFIHDSTASGAALACSTMAPAPIAAAPPARNMRRCKSPLPATCSVSLRDVSFMLVSSLRISQREAL